MTKDHRAMSTPEKMLRLAGGIARSIWWSDPDEATSAAALAVTEALAFPEEERLQVLPTITRRRVADELRRLHGRRGQRPRPASLDEPAEDTDEPINEPPGRDESPEDRALDAFELARAFRLLDDRERNIFERLANGEHLAEIGESYALSESRICQIRREARARLEAKGLGHHEELADTT